MSDVCVPCPVRWRCVCFVSDITRSHSNAEEYLDDEDSDWALCETPSHVFRRVWWGRGARRDLVQTYNGSSALFPTFIIFCRHLSSRPSASHLCEFQSIDIDAFFFTVRLLCRVHLHMLWVCLGAPVAHHGLWGRIHVGTKTLRTAFQTYNFCSSHWNSRYKYRSGLCLSNAHLKISGLHYDFKAFGNS